LIPQHLVLLRGVLLLLVAAVAVLVILGMAPVYRVVLAVLVELPLAV
jgi:hypothetical protein